MRIYLSDARGRGGADIRALTKMRVYLGVPTRQPNRQDLNAMVETRCTRPLRLLFSYHYFKDDDLGELVGLFDGVTEVDVFADSGAYSAWSCGKTIDVDEYIAWVNRWKHLLTVASAPDVIGDAEASTRATERMRTEVDGIPVLPVFHVGEDWGVLEHWRDRADYVALGGMVPYARDRKVLPVWLAKCFEVAPKTAFHGFGMTAWKLLRRFPWYSVDSSSWTSGFRYANPALFDSARGRFVAVDMRSGKSLLRNRALLASYGIRPSEARAASYDRDQFCRAMVESWQRAETWLVQCIWSA